MSEAGAYFANLWNLVNMRLAGFPGSVPRTGRHRPKLPFFAVVGHPRQPSKTKAVERARQACRQGSWAFVHLAAGSGRGDKFSGASVMRKNSDVGGFMIDNSDFSG